MPTCVMCGQPAVSWCSECSADLCEVHINKCCDPIGPDMAGVYTQEEEENETVAVQ